MDSRYDYNYPVRQAFGNARGLDAPRLHALIPGFERATSYPARMPTFEENFRPTWRDPPNIQYGEDWYTQLVTFGGLTPGQSIQVALNIEADSAFEWIQTTFFAQIAGQTVSPTPQITCMVTDGASSRNLFNVPLLIANFSGSNSLPFINPIPRRFMAKSTVLFNFTNIDTVNTWQNCVLALGGRKIFTRDDPALLGSIARFRTWENPDRPGSFYSEDLFVYAWNFGNFAGSSLVTVPTTVLIEADSDFTAIQAAWAAYPTALSAAVVQQAAVSAIVRDGATTRQFSSFNSSGNAGQNGYIGNFFGSQGLPQILPVARVFKAKSPVTISVQQFDPSPLFNMQAVFQGRKIFELN